jgi:indole-3-glycerol phosphate synthase
MTASGIVAPADLLKAIVAATHRITEGRRAREPMAALAKRADARPARPNHFLSALARRDHLNVIAECKRRSPSRGVLRPDYDPVSIARGYEMAGAAAISVLTEPTFFDGALDHLSGVRDAVAVPLLRKDFIVSEYQLVEARASGADAVLLIVAALTPDALSSLRTRAESLGLDVLVEAHDELEVDRAIDAGARIIGVNNRSLRTLGVDLDASERLIGRIPSDTIAVCESGLKTADDLARFSAMGYRAFLIGERLMASPDPGGQLRILLEERTAQTLRSKPTSSARGGGAPRA